MWHRQQLLPTHPPTCPPIHLARTCVEDGQVLVQDELQAGAPLPQAACHALQLLSIAVVGGRQPAASEASGTVGEAGLQARETQALFI